MRHTDNTFTRIYEVVKRIPAGHVATYGMVATLAGNPRMSRVVGYALHVNPDPDHIPCFRVVNRFGECSGSFAFGGKGYLIVGEPHGAGAETEEGGGRGPPYGPRGGFCCVCFGRFYIRGPFGC